MATRRIIKIAISTDAKDAVAAFAEKNGMTEMTVASRVYLWFAAQDDVIRKGVVGVLPEGYEATVIETALKRLLPPAGGTGKGKK